MSDLDAIEARAAAASSGPWSVDGGRDGNRLFWQIGGILRDAYGNNSITSDDEATVKFIAHARTDIPALVAELRSVRAELAAARAASQTGVYDYLAEHDWMYGQPRYATLHHVPRPPDVDDDWLWDVLDLPTTCGLILRGAGIPGVFSRMSTKRCSRCCDLKGYPRGIGSPKNDDACRTLMGLPT